MNARSFVPRGAVVAGVLAGALIAAACSDLQTPTAPRLIEPQALSGGSEMPNAEQAQPQVELCHLDFDTGTYGLIRVAERAVPAHLAHGDGGPGGPVPGREGVTFGPDCSLVNPNPVTIYFVKEDFVRSTVETCCTAFFAGLPPVPALPGDETFTEAFFSGILDRRGNFFRYTFNLPVGFSDLEFAIDVKVNDEMAIYLNDTIIAVQSDTAFVPDPILTYGFTMDASGTVLSTTEAGWDDWNTLTIAPALFQEGLNELTIYGIDTCCGTFEFPGGLLVAAGHVTYLP